MIKVAPMPDELAIAHKERIAWVNGWVDKNQMDVAICQAVNSRAFNGDLEPMLHKLAIISDIPQTEYARLHSMLPLTRVVSYWGDDVHGGIGQNGVSCYRGMKTQRRGTYCCTQCIREDIEYWGFSWYRRRHHLVGVDWCSLHGCLLSQVTASLPFNRNPDHWLKLGKLEQLTTAKDCQPENEFIKRYIDIAEALLLQRGAFSFYNMNLMFTIRISKIKNRSNQNPKLFLLKKFNEQVPRTWLEKIEKEQKLEKKYDANRKIDSVFKSTMPEESRYLYILAMASLYDSVDGMLVDMKNARNFNYFKWYESEYGVEYQGWIDTPCPRVREIFTV